MPPVLVSALLLLLPTGPDACAFSARDSVCNTSLHLQIRHKLRTGEACLSRSAAVVYRAASVIL